MAESQQKAEELDKRFLFGDGFAHLARPEWMFPPGYNSKEATRRLARQLANPNLPGKSTLGEGDEFDPVAARKVIYDAYPKALEGLQMIAGTPDAVIPKLCTVLDVLRPGIFSFWLDGPVPFEDRHTCLRLLAEEVVPALREHGKRIGLADPFERAPGSRPLPADGKPEPVAWPELLRSAS